MTDVREHIKKEDLENIEATTKLFAWYQGEESLAPGDIERFSKWAVENAGLISSSLTELLQRRS